MSEPGDPQTVHVSTDSGICVGCANPSGSDVITDVQELEKLRVLEKVNFVCGISIDKGGICRNCYTSVDRVYQDITFAKDSFHFNISSREVKEKDNVEVVSKEDGLKIYRDYSTESCLACNVHHDQYPMREIYRVTPGTKIKNCHKKFRFVCQLIVRVGFICRKCMDKVSRLYDKAAVVRSDFAEAIQELKTADKVTVNNVSYELPEYTDLTDNLDNLESKPFRTKYKPGEYGPSETVPYTHKPTKSATSPIIISQPAQGTPGKALKAIQPKPSDQSLPTAILLPTGELLPNGEPGYVLVQPENGTMTSTGGNIVSPQDSTALPTKVIEVPPAGKAAASTGSLDMDVWADDEEGKICSFPICKEMI